MAKKLPRLLNMWYNDIILFSKILLAKSKPECNDNHFIEDKITLNFEFLVNF